MLVLFAIHEPANGQVVLELIDALVRDILRQGNLAIAQIKHRDMVEGRMRTFFHVADEADPVVEEVQGNVRYIEIGQRLVQMLRLLDTVSAAIHDGHTLTPRDIYYMQKGEMYELPSPDAVNSLIRLLCLSLGVPRSSLNIYAPSKGIVMGPITITTSLGTNTIQENANVSPIHIRREVTKAGTTTISVVPGTQVRFILVVEKEAIFSQLVSDSITQRLECILLTGRGMPCVASKAFLHICANELPVPVFGIADWNPFGFSILLNYAHGAIKGEPGNYRFAVPRLRALGMLKRDVEMYGQLMTKNAQPLSRLDSVRANSLLETYHPHSQVVPNLAEELTFMQHASFKLELEALNQLEYQRHDFLSRIWLPGRLQNPM